MTLGSVMGQKGAMRNGTEGGYVEWDRKGLCGMGEKGVLWIVARSA